MGDTDLRFECSCDSERIVSAPFIPGKNGKDVVVCLHGCNKHQLSRTIEDSSWITQCQQDTRWFPIHSAFFSYACRGVLMMRRE